MEDARAIHAREVKWRLVLPKITGISKLNNFRFDDGKLLAWRAYAVGSGKLLNVAMDTGRKVK